VNDLRTERGAVLSPSGVPRAPRVLADGRLCFSYDEYGVGFVQYFPPRTHDGNYVVFRKGVFDCFRTFLLRGGLTYQPEYKNTSVLPYSVTCDWELGGAVFGFGVYALDESMVFCLRAPENLTDGFQWKLHFYESTQLIPAETGDLLTGSRGMSREWRTWKKEGNALLGGFHEEGVSEQTLGLSTDVSWRLGCSAAFDWNLSPRNSRHALTVSLEPGRTYLFALTPDAGEARCAARNAALLENFGELLEKQKARYGRVADESPRLRCANPGLERFAELAPLYHESLKAAGGVRAKTTHYWLWGWDMMVSNPSLLYWGDAEFIREMLAFVEATAPEDGRLAHAYTTANTVAAPMADAALGMYVCLLHHYYSLTGDRETLLLRYPFAKKLAERMLKAKSKVGGLLTGTSLFPDFWELLGETGNDLSLFNNSLAYCSLRAAECAAEIAGDAEFAAELRDFLSDMRDNFVKTFYSPKLGAFINSADADSLEHRGCVNVTSLMWENDFLEELVRAKDAECIGFIRENCLGEAYFRAIPFRDASYDLDANQLHCTWPVVEESVVRLANRTGGADILNKWAGWVEYWTDQLLCPEGVPYLIETDRPEPDRWNCEPGTWQAYSVRKWYQDIFHGYLGIVPDAGGVTFSPPGTGGYLVENLHYRGKRLNIEGRGDGRYIEEIRIDGKPVAGTYKTPADCPGENIVVITREKPRPLELRSCFGAEILGWSYNGANAAFSLSGAGTCFVGFYSEKPCEVRLDGAETACGYDAESGTLRFAVVLRPGRGVKCEIAQKD